MKLILILSFLSFSIFASGQNYRELSEQAIACIEQDSLVRAETLLREAMKLEPANPHNAMLFSNLGLVQRRLRQYTDALQSYTLALNMAPRAVPILLDRAALYLEQGIIDRAYSDYCEVLDADVANEEALLMRAYIYTVRRDYKNARVDYNRLLALAPNSYSGRLGLATLEQKEKKFRDALEIVNKLIGEQPDDATLYVARADIEREMEHIDLALIDLDEAIRLLPTSTDAYLLRGDIYLLQKKRALARADFEKAVSFGVPSSELRERFQHCK